MGEMDVEISMGVTTRPGIRHAQDGISLSSVRGMQMVLGRAPRGASVQRARHAFILRLTELLATRGMYRQLVDQLRLTIASTSRMPVAQTMDNVTVEDVARVLAADGVTIPQARDALNLWSQVADANRRTEAMQALMAVRQLSSQEDRDRPVPLEP